MIDGIHCREQLWKGIHSWAWEHAHLDIKTEGKQPTELQLEKEQFLFLVKSWCYEFIKRNFYLYIGEDTIVARKEELFIDVGFTPHPSGGVQIFGRVNGDCCLTMSYNFPEDGGGFSVWFDKLLARHRVKAENSKKLKEWVNHATCNLFDEDECLDLEPDRICRFIDTLRDKVGLEPISFD